MGWLPTGRDFRLVSRQIVVHVENPRCTEHRTCPRLRKPRSRSHTKKASTCFEAVKPDCTAQEKNARPKEDERLSTGIGPPPRSTWVERTDEERHGRIPVRP